MNYLFTYDHELSIYCGTEVMHYVISSFIYLYIYYDKLNTHMLNFYHMNSLSTLSETSLINVSFSSSMNQLLV